MRVCNVKKKNSQQIMHSENPAQLPSLTRATYFYFYEWNIISARGRIYLSMVWGMGMGMAIS